MKDFIHISHPDGRVAEVHAGAMRVWAALGWHPAVIAAAVAAAPVPEVIPVVDEPPPSEPVYTGLLLTRNPFDETRPTDLEQEPPTDVVSEPSKES